jgi:hypothetical protein
LAWKLSLLSDATSTKTLARKENASKKFSQEPLREEKSVQKDQSVQEMAEEVIMRHAMALAHQSGDSLEDARQAVSDTEAGRQLRDLAQGEHRHEKAQDWQGSVFWGRAEERFMHLYCSEALSRPL